MIQQTIHTLKARLNQFDYTVLIFILLMSQDRILVKLGALVFIFLLRFDLRFGLRQNRLPMFYVFIIALEILKYLFTGGSYLGNWATLLISSLYWGMSFLTLHQVKLSIERNGIEKTENTIKAFTWVNFAFCISQMIQVMLVTKAINPYAVDMFAPDIRFPDVMFPYGQSSGDQIRGLFYDSHINAIISQLCFIYFLFNRRYLFALIQFIIIALICFNLVTFLTIFIIFIFLFFFKDKATKLFIAGALVLIGLFYGLVTPENVGYFKNRILSTFSSVMSNKDGMVTESKPVAPKPEQVHAPASTSADSTAIKVETSQPVDTMNRMMLIDTVYDLDHVSGKKIAYSQTFKFMKANPLHAAVGSGAGMFSSKLANNFSGVFYGPTFLNKHLPAPSYTVFYANHGSLDKYLQTLEIGKHSINNFPNSVFDQLLSEYGIVGLLLFLIFYICYFLKRYRQLTYGLVLIPLLLISFNYGYYFESLDITIFFELLMFLDLSRSVKNA